MYHDRRRGRELLRHTKLYMGYRKRGEVLLIFSLSHNSSSRRFTLNCASGELEQKTEKNFFTEHVKNSVELCATGCGDGV